VTVVFTVVLSSQFASFSAPSSELKMAVSRFGIASNKKSALLKQNMRAIAVLLAEDPPKEEKARIKAEALIRDDYMIEAFDILSLNCELLHERIKLISHSKECPPDLVSSVSTLIYAAPRIDIPELVTIRKQFRAKYGKKFEEDALNNARGVLNERVVTKLSVQPPAAYLVQTYLETICEKYEVTWSPTVRLRADNMGEPMAPPSGYSVPIAQGTGLGPVIAITGTTIGDEEISYDGTNGMDLPMAPGQAASAPEVSNNDFAEPDIFIPAAPGSVSTNRTASSTIPPSVPGSVSTNKTASSTIPPSAPGSVSTNKTASSTIPPSAPPEVPSTAKENGNDDDDDKDDTLGSEPSGVQPSSYDDLAARFDNLKHL
jgi:vacuolar protein sorting-associated protein IST1